MFTALVGNLELGSASRKGAVGASGMSSTFTSASSGTVASAKHLHTQGVRVDMSATQLHTQGVRADMSAKQLHTQGVRVGMSTKHLHTQGVRLHTRTHTHVRRVTLGFSDHIAQRMVRHRSRWQGVSATTGDVVGLRVCVHQDTAVGGVGARVARPR